MGNINRIRVYLVIKILLFNLFLIGFFLNLFAYFGSSWVVSSENYVIGIFQYCKKFNFVEISSNLTVDTLDTRNPISLRSTFKCSSWSDSNRPSILKFIKIHFVLLVAIVVGTVSYCVIKSYKNTSNKNDYDNQASVKNFSNHSWKIIKKRILTYLLASGLGFIISKFLFIVF